MISLRMISLYCTTRLCHQIRGLSNSEYFGEETIAICTYLCSYISVCYADSCFLSRLCHTFYLHFQLSWNIFNVSIYYLRIYVFFSYLYCVSETKKKKKFKIESKQHFHQRILNVDRRYLQEEVKEIRFKENLYSDVLGLIKIMWSF